MKIELKYKKEEKMIELEPSEDLINKEAIIRIFDKQFEFEHLPEKVELNIPEDFKEGINIEYIGKNIEIKEIER